MIEVKDLYKAFQGQPVLRGVTLTIPKGSITVILGSSGQGKTVLLKHLIGLLRPDRGRVIVEGTDLNLLDEEGINRFRRKFGMLFQGAALFDSMTVEGNVAFPLIEHRSLTPEEVRGKVREKLSLVGLEGIETKMPAELSGGMRKRVGLARAIALEPEYILYDEPTTGLDPIMTAAINRLIVDMQRKLNITSVIISHDVDSALAISGKIAMLHEGRIIEEGTSSQFRESRHPFVQEFLKAGPLR